VSPRRRAVSIQLRLIGVGIDRCRRNGGCGFPPCGLHAVGKPTFHIGPRLDILVVGEAPGPSGWWLSGKAFYERENSGHLKLSPTGRNLNVCLRILRTSLEKVCFVEAIKCRPDRELKWSPGARVRQNCTRFLKEQVFALRPRLILPLGAKASESCLDITGLRRKAAFSEIAGAPLRWASPWAECVVLPLYHPSPANCGRWPINKKILRAFVRSNIWAS